MVEIKKTPDVEARVKEHGATIEYLYEQLDKGELSETQFKKFLNDLNNKVLDTREVPRFESPPISPVAQRFFKEKNLAGQITYQDLHVIQDQLAGKRVMKKDIEQYLKQKFDNPTGGWLVGQLPESESAAQQSDTEPISKEEKLKKDAETWANVIKTLGGCWLKSKWPTKTGYSDYYPRKNSGEFLTSSKDTPNSIGAFVIDRIGGNEGRLKGANIVLIDKVKSTEIRNYVGAKPSDDDEAGSSDEFVEITYVAWTKQGGRSGYLTTTDAHFYLPQVKGEQLIEAIGKEPILIEMVFRELFAELLTLNNDVNKLRRLKTNRLRVLKIADVPEDTPSGQSYDRQLVDALYKAPVISLDEEVGEASH